MPKKKVLISLDSLHDGGAEMFAIRLANQLALTCDVYLMEFEAAASKEKKLLEKLNPSVPFFSPDKHWLLSSVLFLQNRLGSNHFILNIFFRLKLLLIKQFLWQHKIGVVNSHAIKQNYAFGLIKKKMPSLRFVLTLHGHYELMKSENPVNFEKKIRQDVEIIDDLVYLSDEQLSNFKAAGFNGKRAVRILNGFETEKSVSNSSIFKENPKATLSLMIHSRAIPEKGWKEAIEAFFILIEKGYNVKLILVGDGVQYEYLKELYRHPNLSFVGFSDNVFEYIKVADLGLLPSYFQGESLPNSIVEYLSFGIPVIASNIGAIAEMLTINNNLAGELIDTQKGVPVKSEVLSSLIEKYLVDPNYLPFKRKLAIQAFEKFSMPICVASYNAVLFK
jgi:glycosyltransferase involved in cell wall biosynthesis